MDKSSWIDISLTIHPGMTYWPDNPPISIEPSKVRVKGRKTLKIGKTPLHLTSKNKCTVNLTKLQLLL